MEGIHCIGTGYSLYMLSYFLIFNIWVFLEEEEQLGLEDDTVTDQEAVIGVDLAELEEEPQEQHHQEGEQPLQVE